MCELKTVRQDKHCSSLKSYRIYSCISRQFSVEFLRHSFAVELYPGHATQPHFNSQESARHGPVDCSSRRSRENVHGGWQDHTQTAAAAAA